MIQSKKIQTTVYIESLIQVVRGQRIIMDADLSNLYGVQTKVLNQAVKRNPDRFPSDFVIQLTQKEAEGLLHSRSQSVTLKRGQNIKYLPNVFTEHGAIMTANVLNSPQAVAMSVFVVRAFVKMREQLIGQSSMEKRLLQIENILLAQDGKIGDLYQKIRPLLLPPIDPPRKPIGFRSKENRTS